jgi:hypothetical protein
MNITHYTDDSLLHTEKDCYKKAYVSLLVNLIYMYVFFFVESNNIINISIK